VGLVFAGVGAASGVLTESLDAAIIVMVIFTTFMAPPLLRMVFKTDDEVIATPPAELEVAEEVESSPEAS
jgi:Kef-type K+ transport system membrane component KefB